MVKIEFFSESENSINPQNLKRQKLIFNPKDDFLLQLCLNYKQDFSKVTVADPVSLDDLIIENIEDKPISFPKREVLGEEFTDEDYEKLCAKLSLQNEQFKKHQIKDVSDKVERLKSTFNRLTTEEIFFALKTFEFNEEEVAILLTKSEFISQIRNQIAQMGDKRAILNKKKKQNLIEFENDVDEDDLDEEEEAADGEADSEEDENSYSSISSEVDIEEKKRSRQPSQEISKKVSRLKLDDALANVTDMEGWSEARIRAYQGMEKNPNAYFYRFNAPGEMQRNGAWSKEEDDLFMKRLREFGADGQWGIFSMSIPGRVGYQCSNYYRKLIEIGRIKDSNYSLDDKGKAHYIGGKTRATAVKIENDEESDESESSEGSPVKLSSKSITTQISHEQTRAGFYENPLPGFIDAITQTEVVRPAISPYGHVLSYNTWLQCLLNGDRKNTCPLTNQPLHKRQLIFLTHENIEMYRDKIKNE